MSTPLRLVALLALCCAAPAQAVPAERAWTDPPVRGAETSTAPPAASEPARPAATAPQAKRTAAAAPRPRAEPRTVRRTPKTRLETRLAASPRRVVTVRTLTPTRPDLRSAPSRSVHAQRAFVRPVHEGFIAPPPPPGAFYGDARRQRLRQAEAAGYLVVRRSTVATPDGRILYGYRSYEGDDADD